MVTCDTSVAIQRLQENFPTASLTQIVSDRMSYVILGGRWCHIIVLNVHAPTELKTEDVKDSFYKELERTRMFDKFLNTTWKFC
jgi:hypothetical protein